MNKFTDRFASESGHLHAFFRLGKMFMPPVLDLSFTPAHGLPRHL
ncbi:hypothetical protein [Massilia haematophila]|uniref:Uncharacterized protein n=2 Tax=Massilia TaxID=149698 RepID=A0ABV7PNH0_9BURK